MEPEAIWLEETVHIKQEPVEIKEEQSDCEVKHEDSVPEVNALASDDDDDATSATAIKTEYFDVAEKGDMSMKFEEEPADVFQNIETEEEILVGTSGVHRSSANNSLPVPNLQHVHSSESDVSETGVDLCSYSCDFCNKKFRKLSQLQRHSVFHEDIQSAKLGVTTKRSNLQVKKYNKSKKNPIQHTCYVCNKSFKQRWTLERHTRSHTGQRPFSCEFCPITFIERGHLNEHMRVHTGERPFSCEICNKSFTTRSNLNTHVRTHRDERPFTCEICNRSFTQRGHLKKHIRTHTGQRPFSCATCNKAFSQRGTLITHTRIHSGEQPFPCKICSKSFIRIARLNKHMATHKDDWQC